MAQRRKLERFEESISLNMRLLGVFTRPLTVNVRTRNVSFEGLSIELIEGEESSTLIPHLVLDKQAVELDIVLPGKDQRVRALGKVMWHNPRSRRTADHFKTGIFLEQMEPEDRNAWEEFVGDLAVFWSAIRP
ncbi:MAG: PilZ domain-containing protein [Deltaproteobacteria bacterium]|nr:MAG: PilZ domain-containing protein [Deltaproteobacteria bacterium]